MNLNKIRDNVEAVRRSIADAAIRSGRTPEDVRLVAVSKYAAADDGTVPALIAAGAYDLGESRPQSLVDKVEYLNLPPDSPVRWHMIGSLQRNKARKILPLVSLIHSIDSIRLLEAIDRIAAEENLVSKVLLEVNVSGDRNKHGFNPHDFPTALERMADFTNIRICGMMCMSGLNAGSGEARREFASLRELAGSLSGKCPENAEMKELSMGMSDDFEIAIEEGATLVRVGSRLMRK